MINPLITVIVPAYNASSTISRCLESIMNQTYTNLEIIVIDNNSIDNTHRLVQTYQEKDRRIQLHRETKSGASHARNLGLTIAKGVYIAFVDSDDTINPTFISQLAQKALSTGADVVACNMNFIYGKHVQRPLKFHSKDTDQEGFVVALIQEIQGYIGNKLYRHAILQNKKFNSTIQMSEDFLFNVEISRKVQKATLLNEYLYNYYLSPRSLSHGEFSQQRGTKFEADQKIFSNISTNFPHLIPTYAYSLLLTSYANQYALHKSKLHNHQLEQLAKNNITLFKSRLPENLNLSQHLKIFLYARAYGLIKILKNIKHRFGEPYDQA